MEDKKEKKKENEKRDLFQTENTNKRCSYLVHASTSHNIET